MNMLTLPCYLTHLRINENITPPLHNHPDINLMIDTLNRLERHHLLLAGTASDKINLALIESMMSHLASSPIAKTLQDAHFFYFDCNQLFLEENKLAQFIQDAQNTQKPIVLILNRIEPLYTNNHLQTLLFEKQWRFVVFSDLKKSAKANDPFALEEIFSTISLTDPSPSQLLALLKSHCTHLENFHQVTIPDEVISFALTLANHYFYSPCYFDQALELLDSSAARTSTNERADISGKFNPAVSNTILTEVVASLTHIPSSHLQQNNAFQAKSFVNAMTQSIMGQEKAIELIGNALQQTYIKLHEKKGPLCSFLWVGPTEVGKTELAYSMAKYLFGKTNALLPVMLDKGISSLRDIQIITQASQQPLNLLQAIRKMPYAIILIDDIKFEHIPTLELFKDIFMQGYVIEQGEKYNFSRTTFIMTTRMGAEPINHLIRPQQEPNRTSNLLQLVLNENVLDIPTQIHHSLSTQELCDAVMPILEKHFSMPALQKSHLIPFVPLDFTALEKMIRLKIKNLIKTLDARFGIELGYTPEVIKFLAHEAYWRKANKSLEKLLDQLLYSCISQEIIHTQEKNRAKRLLLQLNENGQSLKCQGVVESTLHRVTT